MADTITRGVQQAGETRTYWVVYDDGSIGTIETTTGGGEDPALDKPGLFVTEAVYLLQRAEMDTTRQARLEAIREEENTGMRLDYEALLAAGIPAATAERLSGYEAPDTATAAPGEARRRT
jgi:hypothetical protein